MHFLLQIQSLDDRYLNLIVFLHSAPEKTFEDTYFFCTDATCIKSDNKSEVMHTCINKDSSNRKFEHVDAI